MKIIKEKERGISMINNKTYVSKIVKNSIGKSYMEVDGKPFLYNSVQSWYPPECDYSEYVKRAAEANYKCFTFWLYWSALEPERGTRDWTELDNIIKLAIMYDMRLDIVWGGTNFCGQIDPRFAPQWLLKEHKYHVKNDGGSCVIVDGGDMGPCHAFDPTNEEVFKAEKKMVEDMLTYLQTKDLTHRVIAFQVENEINMKQYVGGKTEILEYVNKLAGVLKAHQYQLITRVNVCQRDMDAEIDLLDNVDGHGCDTYGFELSATKGAITSKRNTKFSYIAENAAYSNTVSHIVTALANNGFYNVYKLDYDHVFPDRPGIYKIEWEDWSVTKEVRNLNSGLNRIAALVAKTSNCMIVEFNTETDTPSDNYHNMKNLLGQKIGLMSRNTAPVGLAIVEDNAYYFVADKDAYILTESKPVICQSGYFDNCDEWVNLGYKSIDNLHAQFQISYSAGECVKVVL